MLVRGVALFVKLEIEPGVNCQMRSICVEMTHQFQNSHFHHTLVEVSRLILHHFDRDDLVRFHILTFDNLAERALAKNVQNEVPVLMFSANRMENGQRL